MHVFTPEQAAARLSQTPGWAIEEGQLTKTFQFANFVQALEFVGRIGALAERRAHHPDIDIRYNRVRLSLCTHDANALTERDFALAGEVNRLMDGEK